jgi:hypothetical protein
VAPPGNQAATEKTNINLYHSENPVYPPKVGPIQMRLPAGRQGRQGMRIVEFGVSVKLKAQSERGQWVTES